MAGSTDCPEGAALRFVFFITWVLHIAVFAGVGLADTPPRVALLIGNQNYAETVGGLSTPHNDIDTVGRALREIGFDVEALEDASYRKMDIAIRRYVDRVRMAGPGAIGFFYYSGHGVANPATRLNYLVPIDVSSAEDKDLWYESFQQDEIINRFTKLADKATHFVIFDCCKSELKLTGQASKALGSNKGFLPVADTNGVLVAYATAPGQAVTNSGRRFSSYARALAVELGKPGVEAVTMFRNVQISVRQSTGQSPWLSLPALPPVYLSGRTTSTGQNPTRPESTAAMRGSAFDPKNDELKLWSSIKTSEDPDSLQAFVKSFPNGVFAPLARLRLQKLKRQRLARLPNASASTASGPNAAAYATDAQRLLKALGCYSGPLDGKWGKGSDRALRRALGARWATEGPSVDVIRKLKTAKNINCKTVKAAPRKKAPSKATVPSARKKSAAKNCLSFSKCVKYCGQFNGARDPASCARYCTRKKGQRTGRRGWLIC